MPAFSLENGDLGVVTLDGKEVKATSCDTDLGWAMCHWGYDGEPVGIDELSICTAESSIVREIVQHRFEGEVKFTPLPKESN